MNDEKKWGAYWRSYRPSAMGQLYQELVGGRMLQYFNSIGLSEGRVLDVGCGQGYLDYVLAKDSRLQVTGVDISEEALDTARKLIEEKNLGGRVSFLRADVFKLPFPDDSFDAAVSTGYESAAAYMGAAEEVRRVVKKGGPIILDFVNLPNLYQPASSVKRFFEYRKEKAEVEKGKKWGDPGLKHYHYGKLGLRERFEESLGLRIEDEWRMLTSPPKLGSRLFEETAGRLLNPLLGRVLVVRLRNTK